MDTESIVKIQAAEHTLVRAQWQPVLFAERPSRLDLLKLKVDWPLTPLRIRVHRNHSFEHVASVVAPWFAWWRRGALFHYSDYDDSLSFAFTEGEQAQLELIWLDVHRYEGQFSLLELSDWLGARFAALRARTSAPILLVATGASNELHEQLVNIARSVPGVRVADMRLLAGKLGLRFYDERATKFSGTRLSDSACMLVARELACHWVPAMLIPRLKALALDLDHTLYAGVLGEDGVQVPLTPAHKTLQQFLVGLREQGVFLAVVSKNEEIDVRLLFGQRKDFPLRWEDFSATAVSWGSKSDGLHHVAQALRIGLDAMLFVDDNPGELAAAASALPALLTAHASADAVLTQRMLEYYPGLWAWERNTADELRVTDLAADTERARLAVEAVDPREYLRSIQVKMRLELSPHIHLTRLHELSQKTNQFNLTLQRLSEVDLSRLLGAPDHRVVAISLSDRLSDSGLIGLVVAQRHEQTLVVRELAISCRALGRRLEDLMIAESVRALLADLPAECVEFVHRTGPRNGPGREWLSRLIRQNLPPEGRVAAHRFLAEISAAAYPVAIEIVHH